MPAPLSLRTQWWWLEGGFLLTLSVPLSGFTPSPDTRSSSQTWWHPEKAMPVLTSWIVQIGWWVYQQCDYDYINWYKNKVKKWNFLKAFVFLCLLLSNLCMICRSTLSLAAWTRLMNICQVQSCWSMAELPGPALDLSPHLGGGWEAPRWTTRL